MNQLLANKVESKFKLNFGLKPEKLIYSPGRINLIGEHVDYNNGIVLPGAIDKAFYIAIAPSSQKSCVYALDLKSHAEFDVHNLSKSSASWENYIFGICDEIVKAKFPLENFIAVIGSDIPVGAGLSSSAALDCGVGFALSELFNLEISRLDLALMAQRGEHEFVGVKSGIMDQVVNLLAKENHIMCFDTKTKACTFKKLDLGDYQLVLFNSHVSHELVSSEYNDRRETCEKVLEQIQFLNPEVQSLRDCTHEMLYSIKELIGEIDYFKVKYIIDEMLRVQATINALDADEFLTLGKLLNETHAGLKDLYQVSCKEIDYIQELTTRQQGVLGSRLMGGGFGGCTLNLIHRDAIQSIVELVTKAYQKVYNIEMSVIPVELKGRTYSIY